MIEEKEKEKIGNHQDLRSELQKIWNVRVKIIPLVVAFLGAVPKQFRNRLKEAGLTAEIGQVLMTTLLGKAKILRQVLESKAAGCGLILSEFSSIVILPVN